MQSSSSIEQSIFGRFQKWVALSIAFCVLLYVGFSVWSGIDEISKELRHFEWSMFGLALLLTISNYGLRFLKWRYLLGRLEIAMPWQVDVWNFVAGLSMAISPAKAGELLKPYVVREITKTPMIRTIPALITERLTDGIAMLFLASLGITTYAADKIEWLVIPAVITLVGLGILASKDMTEMICSVLEKLPIFNKIIPKIREMIDSMRICVAPLALFWTVLLSVVAWAAECIAYQCIFAGLQIDASFDVCFFVYAFATIAGSAMPGGLGVSDGALVGGAMQFLSVTQGQAVTVALLTRLATLWLGVGLGAIALIRLSTLLEAHNNASSHTHSTDIPPTT